MIVAVFSPTTDTRPCGDNQQNELPERRDVEHVLGGREQALGNCYVDANVQCPGFVSRHRQRVFRIFTEAGVDIDACFTPCSSGFRARGWGGGGQT